jgi:mannose-6-phosphate isomerase
VSAVRRLASRAFPKVWGTPRTAPWFANPNNEQTGEVWFESPSATPLLIKFLFTSESLSIQVHPDDEYAAKHHDSRGKTEMWHILRAEPGAQIAIGPRREITREELKKAAGSKAILDLLNFEEVRAGETWFIPAGTIHALGGGLALCEIQQLSDVTYRLYDYERARDLHIEHGVTVSRLAPCEGKRVPAVVSRGRELLAECDYFRTEKLTISGAAACDAHRIYIVLEGNGRIGTEAFETGQAFSVFESGACIEAEQATILAVTANPGV